MRFLTLTRVFACCGALASVVAQARAEPLPWLSDPWRADRKVASYGAKLRPVHCPPKPDLRSALTLGEAVTQAMCHNPDAKAAYLNLLSQAARFGGAYSSYLFDASASATAGQSYAFSEGPTNSRTKSQSTGVSYALSTTLFDFGRSSDSLEASELALLAAGHSYDSTLQGMIATIFKAYYQLLTAQNGLEVAKESEAFARASHDAAQLRHKIGQAPLSDALQARGAYSQALLSTRQADNQWLQNRAALALLLGFPPDAAVRVAEVDDRELMKAPFGDQLKTLMARAKHERVDLAAKRLSLEGADASLRALRKARLPSVRGSISGSYSDIDLFNHSTPRSQAIGVSVSIPIFPGFGQTYSETAAERSLEAQREGLVQAERAVEQDVFQAWNNYQTSQESWETSWDLLASATQLRDVALGRYKEGVGTILDVLSAQSQYRSALQSHLQNRYNLLTTRVDLVRAVGVLNLEMVNVTKPLKTRPDRLLKSKKNP